MMCSSVYDRNQCKEKRVFSLMQLQAAGAIKAINAASHATYKVPRSPARSTIGRSLQFLKQS